MQFQLHIRIASGALNNTHALIPPLSSPCRDSAVIDQVCNWASCFYNSPLDSDNQPSCRPMISMLCARHITASLSQPPPPAIIITVFKYLELLSGCGSKYTWKTFDVFHPLPYLSLPSRVSRWSCPYFSYSCHHRLAMPSCSYIFTVPVPLPLPLWLLFFFSI